MRHLSPAGTPINLGDWSAWLKTIFHSSQTVDNFRQEICGRFRVKHAFFLSTGRAAMVLLLQVLKEISGEKKDQVIIPSYTCFSVPSSIIKAGLKVRVCDVDPTTLDYDYEKLAQFDFSRVVCVIPANLYGIPNDLPRLARLASEHGVFLIDDAAQSMGAQVAGRFSGSFGDAGIFSLDKGKVITSMNGGVIVTNSDQIARSVSLKMDNLRPPAPLWSLSELAKLLIYSFFLDPSRYWLPASLPFLNLGSTVYTTDYPVTKYNKLLCGIAFQLLKQLDELNRIRKANGEYYMDALRNIPWAQVVDIKHTVLPVFLRFPLLVTEAKERVRIEKELVRLRLGATLSFPSSVTDIVELRPKLLDFDIQALGGKTVANQILTLPTHPYVTKGDLDSIIEVIATN